MSKLKYNLLFFTFDKIAKMNNLLRKKNKKLTFESIFLDNVNFGLQLKFENVNFQNQLTSKSINFKH